MNARIDEGAIIMLTVNFDKAARDGAQGLSAHRLIIDEGAGAPVRHLDAAQNELAVRFNVLRASRHKCRMLGRQIEDGGDLALRFAMPDERPVAARAEAQGEGVEQNRLAGTRLAGEHGEAAPELKIELVDQHNVANGELNEHGLRCRSPAPAGSPSDWQRASKPNAPKMKHLSGMGQI